MSGVQRMDRSPENGWTPPATTMRQWTQIHNNRNRPNWPFLISYEEGTVYINKGKKQSKYIQATIAGDALI